MCWEFIPFLWLNHQNNAYGAHGKQAYTHIHSRNTTKHPLTHTYIRLLGTLDQVVCICIRFHTFISGIYIFRKFFTLFRNVLKHLPMLQIEPIFQLQEIRLLKNISRTCKQIKWIPEPLINWFNNNCRAMNLSDIIL